MDRYPTGGDRSLCASDMASVDGGSPIATLAAAAAVRRVRFEAVVAARHDVAVAVREARSMGATWRLVGDTGGVRADTARSWGNGPVPGTVNELRTGPRPVADRRLRDSRLAVVAAISAKRRDAQAAVTAQRREMRTVGAAQTSEQRIAAASQLIELRGVEASLRCDLVEAGWAARAAGATYRLIGDAAELQAATIRRFMQNQSQPGNGTGKGQQPVPESPHAALTAVVSAQRRVRDAQRASHEATRHVADTARAAKTAGARDHELGDACGTSESAAIKLMNNHSAVSERPADTTADPPSTADTRNGSPIETLAAASAMRRRRLEAVIAARHDLAVALQAAHAAGMSWRVIGTACNVKWQTARNWARSPGTVAALRPGPRPVVDPQLLATRLEAVAAHGARRSELRTEIRALRRSRNNARTSQLSRLQAAEAALRPDLAEAGWAAHAAGATYQQLGKAAGLTGGGMRVFMKQWAADRGAPERPADH